MNRFNGTLIKILAILALLPLVPSIMISITAISPILPFLLILALGWVFIPGFRPVGWLLSALGGFFRTIASVLFTALAIVGKSIALLFGLLPLPTRSARFMGFFERLLLLNSGHRGFLLDGHRKRLSEKHSFQSIITVGGMGRGKSSVFVMPNLYTLKDCSFVVSDTSGEIYQQTSGYLASQGFRIRVLNLMNLTESETYNPLARAHDHTRIAQAAEIIIRSSFKDPTQDPFWNTGAEKIIRIFIQCLHNMGDPALCNLANLKHLLAQFDAHLTPTGQLSKTDQFVMNATRNDPSTYSDYQGFTGGNDRTMLSFLSTADAALSPIGNPHLASLTASNSIDFSDLRRHKTVLYVLVRQQDMPYYRFLLNLFYTDLFDALLTGLSPNQLPVYMLLDEFGHLSIPNFDVFATTARKYRVGFWIFLQSLSQLESRYGPREAETILDGLQSEIYLPGLNLDTAQKLERRLGRVQVDGGLSRTLFSADEIIRMKDDRALFLYSNKRPVHLKVKPYYKQWAMRRASKITPVQLPNRAQTPVRLVQL